MAGFPKPGTSQPPASSLFGGPPLGQGVQPTGFGGAPANAGQPGQGFGSGFGGPSSAGQQGQGLLPAANQGQTGQGGGFGQGFPSQSANQNQALVAFGGTSGQPGQTGNFGGQFGGPAANQGFSQGAGGAPASPFGGSGLLSGGTANPFGKVEAANGGQKSGFTTGFQPVPTPQDQPKAGFFAGFGQTSQQAAAPIGFPAPGDQSKLGQFGDGNKTGLGGTGTSPFGQKPGPTSPFFSSGSGPGQSAPQNTQAFPAPSANLQPGQQPGFAAPFGQSQPSQAPPSQPQGGLFNPQQGASPFQQSGAATFAAGQQSAASPFGQQPVASSQPPAQQNPGPTTNLFDQKIGTSAPATGQPFGQQVTGSAFTQPASAPGTNPQTGQSAAAPSTGGGLFGTQPTTGGGLFGAKPGTQPSTGLFATGQPASGQPAAPAIEKPGPSQLFSASPSDAKPGTANPSIFGATTNPLAAPAPATGSLFSGSPSKPGVPAAPSGTPSTSGTGAAGAPKPGAQAILEESKKQILGRKRIQDVLTEWKQTIDTQYQHFQQLGHKTVEIEKQSYESHKELLMLNEIVTKLVNTSNQLNENLDLIISEQNELNSGLEAVEQELDRELERAGISSMYLNQQYQDERESVYVKANLVKKNIDEVEGSFNVLLQALNEGHDEDLRSVEGDVERSLDVYLDTLNWIESNVYMLDARLNALEREYQETTQQAYR